MIRYNRGRRGLVILSNCKLFIGVLRGECFGFALKVALWCGFVACVLKHIDTRRLEGSLADWIPADSVYSNVGFLIGFVVVFRTNQAYTRFFEGVELMQKTPGDFFDTASVLCAFTRTADAPEEVTRDFRQLLVRMVSFLYMACLSELETVQGKRTYGFKLVDPQGIDPATLENMQSGGHPKAEAVAQQIQHLIMDHLHTGALKGTPPPLLTRAFQELNAGMLKFHESSKFREAPFPFPYVAVTEVLLVMHAIVTPFFVQSGLRRLVPLSFLRCCRPSSCGH